MMIHCLSDDRTCEFFADFPRQYRLEYRSAARIYFPQGIFPNASEECCMADLEELLERFNNAEIITSPAEKPRCLAIDNHKHYLVTVNDRGQSIYRFHLRNLTQVGGVNLPNTQLMNIADHAHAFYVSDESGRVIILESENLTEIDAIDRGEIQLARDIIFLHEGRTMVVASKQRITFFNRSNTSNHQYTYEYHQETSYQYPHGLFYVNETFFHVASWDGNAIYSYSTVDGRHWKESVFAKTPSLTANDAGGSHVMIDKCQRRWLSIVNFGIVIYDDRGNYLGNITRFGTNIFDAVLTNNYILYLSSSKDNNITRLDPKVNC